MHNNIMAAGSRDRPPMLATGRYAQWRSRFLRYIDTRPNGDALRKCILEGLYTPTTVVVPAVPATKNSPAVPEQTTVETLKKRGKPSKGYNKEKLKEARSRQKSYADKHRRDLEFQVGDRVFLKVSPFRGVKCFGIKGKLSPRFIGPFEILERIGEVSYRLALPPQLSHVHDVFHVSLLRGYQYHPLC
ncbi:hypothetical protein Tco_0953065 [Tanacetum coccineum]|uniref:Tf2-1-like SH3-like domain-containing protein n=1 Tax=Tanacetum coccineum TaxID=301880 RepID=A0ABQ5DZ28_9ASTR